MHRRHALLTAAGAGLTRRAAAQPDFPRRIVRIIVPYAPGGASDIVVRLIAQQATGATGQSFVVENRGGGASVPGTQAVATATPDGYTIGSADNAIVVNPAVLRERLPYDTERDLAPLGIAVTAPTVLVSHPDAPARDLPSVLAEARARPDGIAVAHGGIGTANHLAAVQFQLAVGRPMTLVGYRGGGPEAAALVAGEVPYGFCAVPPVLPQILAGRLRVLAVAGAARSPRLPEVPTLAEAGLPDVDVQGFWGLLAPAAVPAHVLHRLHGILQAATLAPAVKTRLEELHYTVVAGSPADFGALLHREIVRWRDVFGRIGVPVE